MTIKHPERIHFLRAGRYLCNRACYTTKAKSKRIPGSVTCKNCLHLLAMEAKKRAYMRRYQDECDERR